MTRLAEAYMGYVCDVPDGIIVECSRCETKSPFMTGMRAPLECPGCSSDMHLPPYPVDW